MGGTARCDGGGVPVSDEWEPMELPDEDSKSGIEQGVPGKLNKCGGMSQTECGGGKDRMFSRQSGLRKKVFGIDDQQTKGRKMASLILKAKGVL